MKEPGKCPKCGFEDLMESVGRLGTIRRKYICPNCKYQFEK
jgi:transposase-like protein